MLYYILDENNKIKEYCEKPLPHWGEEYLQTEEDILLVSNGVEGDILLLKSEYDDYVQTTEYINKVKQKTKGAINLEYVDKFNAFDIMWSRNVSLGRKTSAQYLTARNALVAELTTKLTEV